MTLAQGFRTQTAELTGFELIRHALVNSTCRPPSFVSKTLKPTS